jgi:oxygen-independent coproporphyrinogen-3 oxidase
LGCSAISDAYYAYGQNEKNISDYLEKISNNEFPIIKGHIQSEKDLNIKPFIMDLICNHTVPWDVATEISAVLSEKLNEFLDEGLVYIGSNKINVTEKGKPFVRNICMAFDPYIQKPENSSPAFSKAI